MKPKDISKKLSISTSLLRYYEDLGLLPEVPRTPSGYREYETIHYLHFKCIRGMLPGFGMELLKEILPLTDPLKASLTVAAAQSSLFSERARAFKTFKKMEEEASFLKELMKSKNSLNIKELAQAAGITEDALRYWEKTGFIAPSRGHNNYRLYDAKCVKQVLVMAALKPTSYFVPSPVEGYSLKAYDDLVIVQLSGVKAFWELVEYFSP
ncbi:MAG: MerR family DNA-binding transcriptional regulator [Turicibacter sp.]|nr:MerR family DNA-binding transcriptional regulator [Turicibacter sp.]